MTLISLASIEFQVSDIYAEGQPMTGREAAVLNSTRAENIRNMLDKRLRRYPRGKQQALADERFISQLRDEATILDQSYRFAARSAGASPLEEMIKQVAIEHAQQELRAAGASDPIELALRAGALQQDDGIRREALTRLEEQKIAAQRALEDLIS